MALAMSCHTRWKMVQADQLLLHPKHCQQPKRNTLNLRKKVKWGEKISSISVRKEIPNPFCPQAASVLLFSDQKAVPARASARIQRWVLTLSVYDYSIVYTPGKELPNADMLSRLLLQVTVPDPPLPGELALLMETLHNSPVKVTDIKRWTDHDPVLSRVQNLVQQGWGESLRTPCNLMLKRRMSISACRLCAMGQSSCHSEGRVLEQLHDSHPGVSRMKALARGVVWWPGVDNDVEATVKGCLQCDASQKLPAQVPIHPWEWPARPWSRLHMDYAGPFLNRMFLLDVDARSKWLEVVIMPSAKNTIKALRVMFATHGIPDMQRNAIHKCRVPGVYSQKWHSSFEISPISSWIS